MFLRALCKIDLERSWSFSPKELRVPSGLGSLGTETSKKAIVVVRQGGGRGDRE